MAAAAYGGVVSLLNTMDQFQSHPRLSICFDEYQNEILRSNVDFFLEFVENYSGADSREVEDLVGRIAVAAHEAEDIIEVEAADRIRGGSSRKSLTLLLNLQRIIEGMNSIKEKVLKVKEESGLFVNPTPPPPSSIPPATMKATMFGFEGYVAQLLDDLTSSNSGRQILPIVGMGGIGKTTLARNVYENSLMLHHFDVFRAWVTVSQDFNATQILLQALSCLGGSKSRNDRSDDEIGEELYKKLSGRRYLVVLDDVCSVKAWEKIKFFFPDNSNGSRIVVTTRQQELVDYFASSALAVDFLDDVNSWALFCSKTFAKEGCPLELEQVGRKIVKKCKGLPLSITVIGGLLGKSPRTREYWEEIAHDKSLILEYSDEGNTPSSILYLSYKHLPIWLRSCFLYLGLFPEDHLFEVYQLIQLWVAEGYIKPSKNQSLEEVAESYLKDLVHRNLLLFSDLSLNKKFKTCWIHDLVREMCIRIAEKENFYRAGREIAGIADQRRARSLASETPFKRRLLRVLVDEMVIQDPAIELVNLRFLSQNYNTSLLHIPPSISSCWSLQTLILEISDSIAVPLEIWKMPQLRHIQMLSMSLPPPPPPLDESTVLRNLHTLKKVDNLIFSEEICKRIPNVKELHIEYNLNEEDACTFHLQNVGCLNKLELLRYSSSPEECVNEPLQNLKLPRSLKELSLFNCRLLQSDMSMIASLPHLQVLELLGKPRGNPKWDCVEEEFLSLKHLSIYYWCDLMYWDAESSSFPVLETLNLWDLSKLEEIPSGVGEVSTLEKIYVYNCSKSAAMSAVKILEEQESLGNVDLRLQLDFSFKAEAEMWREEIQELGITCENLLISCKY